MIANHHQITSEIHKSLIKIWEANGCQIISAEIISNDAKNLAQKNYPDLDETQIAHITSSLLDKLLGFGPLEPLLKNPDITEIMINGIESSFVEKHGVIEPTQILFQSESELLGVINKIVSIINRRVDESMPYVDARLPDGARVNAIIKPLAINGPILTIRKFPANPLTMFDLIAKQTLSKAMAQFLDKAIKSKQNIVISGGTGTGKTSLLNALASLIPLNERLITIEDAAEIKLSHPHVVRLEARLPNIEGIGEITVRTLLKNALRMRPNRIIVGETRGGEALDMLQAMNTGHQGSLTTVHANSPEETLSRLETMALMAEINLPAQAIRTQINRAINIIIQMERLPIGERKIISISRVSIKPNTNHAIIETLFQYNKTTNQFILCS